ncbi:uncharacterized protein LOC126879697 [Diabrotica virgifera virgifera]|uniref:Uncharacterized protein n=1 Tax=Diabrotica virgifera virgifera TaxID=50390 RepID=A0ABM5JLM4_DIAVI|nr:uncharacterized protein LOC126879697 [Diabrotica virgifera virgifera]
MKIPIVLFVLFSALYIDCKENQNDVRVLAFGETINRLPHAVFNVRNRKVRAVAEKDLVSSSSVSDFTPNLKHKRCSPRLGLSLSSRLATSKELPEDKNKKNTMLYEAFCKTCTGKYKCTSLSECPTCEKWCLNGLPDCDPKKEIDSKPENPEKDKSNKEAAESDGQIVGVSNRGSFDDKQGISHNVYRFNVEDGTLRDKILNFLSIPNTKSIDSVIVTVKTLLDQPLNLEKIGANVKHDIETTVSEKIIPAQNTALDQQDLDVSKSKGTVLEPRELDRIVSEILAKLREQNARENDDSPVLGSTNNQNSELRDSQPDHILHQGVMNPDIIEGPPDESNILGEQEKMSEDMIEQPENLQVLNRNAELQANEEFPSQLSPNPEEPTNQDNLDDAIFPEADTENAGRPATLMAKGPSDTFEKLKTNNLEGANPSASYHKIEIPDQRTTGLLHHHHHHHHHHLHKVLPRTKNPAVEFGPPSRQAQILGQPKESSYREAAFSNFDDPNFHDPHFHESQFHDPHFHQHSFDSPNFIDSDFNDQRFHHRIPSSNRQHFRSEFPEMQFNHPDRFPQSHSTFTDDHFNNRFFPRTSKSESPVKNEAQDKSILGEDKKLGDKSADTPVGAVHITDENNLQSNVQHDESKMPSLNNPEKEQIQFSSRGNEFQDPEVAMPAPSYGSDNSKLDLENKGNTKDKQINSAVPRIPEDTEDGNSLPIEDDLEHSDRVGAPNSLPARDHLEEEEKNDSPKIKLGARTSELLRKIKEKQDQTLQKIAAQRQNFERAREGLKSEIDKDTSKQDDTALKDLADPQGKSNAGGDLQQAPREAAVDNFDSPQSILQQLQQIVNDDENNKRENEVLGSQPLENGWENLQLGSNGPWNGHGVASRHNEMMDEPNGSNQVDDERVSASLDKNNVDTGPREQVNNNENNASNSLGSLVPVSDNIEVSFKDPEHLYFIGNGIKLPLKMVKTPNGSIQVTVDLDKLCSCNNITCPKDPKDRSELEQTVGNILEQEVEQLDDSKDISVGMPKPEIIAEDESLNSNSLQDTQNKKQTHFEDSQRNRRWFNRHKRSIDTLTPVEIKLKTKSPLPGVVGESFNNFVDSQVNNLANLFTPSQQELNEKSGIHSFIKDILKKAVSDDQTKLSDKKIKDNHYKNVFVVNPSSQKDSGKTVIPIDRFYKFKGVEDEIGSSIEKIEKTLNNYAQIDNTILENESSILRRMNEDPIIQKEVDLVKNILTFLKNLTVDN